MEIHLWPETKNNGVDKGNVFLGLFDSEVNRRKERPYIIAYNVQPNDQISVLSSISAWLGQSHNSGARKGAEQCSDAHSYITTPPTNPAIRK